MRIINIEEEAILARFVYALTFILGKRFPSAKIHFYKPPTGQLVVHVEVLKSEDYGDRSVNPKLSVNAGNAIVGFLRSVGIVPHHASTDPVYIEQNSLTGFNTSAFHSYNIWLKVDFDDFHKVIGQLDLVLPLIPRHQDVPDVLIRDST